MPLTSYSLDVIRHGPPPNPRGVVSTSTQPAPAPAPATAIPRDPAALRAWLKYQLELRGLTLGGLARELGFSRTTAQGVLWRPYPRIEREIAARLDLTPAQIWPERYTNTGSPIRKQMGRPRKNHTVPEVA